MDAGTIWFERAALVAAGAGLAQLHLRAEQELALAVWTRGDLQPLHDVRAVAARYGALVTVAVMDLSLADIALSSFDRERCLAAARACVEASRRYGLATEPVAHLWLAGAHALHGDHEAMQAATDAALAPDPDDPRILGDLYGRVLVTSAFVDDDLDRLPGILDTMIEHVRVAPPTTSVYPGRILWAMLHAVDDDDLGVAARAEFAEAAERVGLLLYARCGDLIEAVALGRQGDAEAATARFTPAYERLCGHGLSAGSIRTLALLAARSALRDGWGEPVRWLRESEAFFGSRGYDRLARRCRTMLGEAGVPVPRRGRGESEVPPSLRALGVTSREMDVLKLVMAGCTNKDVAAELYLSPKTVERHLSSLFTRLGVANRRDLADQARPHLGEPGP
jgi:DNA-binding CsgD family transcriptional regulator